MDVDQMLCDRLTTAADRYDYLYVRTIPGTLEIIVSWQIRGHAERMVIDVTSFEQERWAKRRVLDLAADNFYPLYYAEAAVLVRIINQLCL